MCLPFLLIAMPLLVLSLSNEGIDYPYATDEPQKSGWPISAEERSYIVDKPEHERRPGRESNKHLPHLWPVVPSAGYFGGDSWLKLHEAHVKIVQANRGPLDVLLVGDSITIQWADSWQKHFPDRKAINIGIGGDKTQNVLWRIDHGGVEGLEPKSILLMIGNNNMFFAPETGVDAAAQGIEMCVRNLRDKFPSAKIIVAKILPAHAPGVRFYEDIKKTNRALDALNLSTDPQVSVLDLTDDFLDEDGFLKKDLYTSDNIHLSAAGYAVYAIKLKPILDAILSGMPIPMTPPRKSEKPFSVPRNAPAPSAPEAAASIHLNSKPVLKYPYAPYNEGKMDPQITGWPLSAEELLWVLKGEYVRKPGHELQKHLPDMWCVTPTAARWGGDGQANGWIELHAKCVEQVQANKEKIDIALIGDSITQGWGGGADGAPFNSAWKRHLHEYKTVNLGIGGDRIENILWRLDHGALEGVSPKFIVLMIGVNNAPLVQSNGVGLDAVAQGIELCLENLSRRCPDSRIVLLKILPAFDPSKEVGLRIFEINAKIDNLDSVSNRKVILVDLWSEFLNADGGLKTSLYSDGHLHLSPEGYEVLASKLKLVFAQRK